jgi:hypothetical protein
MIFDRLNEYEGGGGFDGTHCPDYYRRNPSCIVRAFCPDDAEEPRQEKKPAPSHTALLWLEETQ